MCYLALADNVTLHIDGILYLKVLDSYKVGSNTISSIIATLSNYLKSLLLVVVD